MAKPQNPLDDFSVYVYHMALFLHHSQTELEEEMNNFNWEKASTTRTKASAVSPHCLINSVTDAYQIIDQLRIQQIAPSVPGGNQNSPLGQFDMKIDEPGNMMFMSKIKTLMQDLEISAYSSMIWGVKIKFVGRYPDNEIAHVLDIPPIFGILQDIKGEFNHMGSTYNLSFVMCDTVGTGTNAQHATSQGIGTLIDPITIKAKTLGEAINQLQTKAQLYYDVRIAKLEENEMKKVRYAFSVKSPDIAGFKLSGHIRDSLDSDEVYIHIPAGTTITDAFSEIIKRCDELLKIIGESKDAWKQPGHPRGKMYQILSGIEVTNTECIVKFTLVLYNGIDKLPSTDQALYVEDTTHSLYEFDYYYAEDYNIDILRFDISSTSGLMLYLISSPNVSKDAIMAGSRNDAGQFKGEASQGGTTINTNDKADKEIESNETTKVKVKGSRNDVLYLQASPSVVQTGYPGADNQATSSRTAALESLAKYTSIDSAVTSCTIRGHAQILWRALARNNGFGVNESIWVKLNIRTWDNENPEAEPEKFFYDGRYWLTAVEHIFSDGKFVQELTLHMTELDQLNNR